MNEARSDMQSVTTNTGREIVHALETGNLGYFFDFIESTENVLLDYQGEYRQVMLFLWNALEASSGDTFKIGLSKNEVQTLCKYLLGWVQPPAKFGKVIARSGMSFVTSRIRRGDRTMPGRYFEFHITDQALETGRSIFTKKPNLRVVG
jgi:hypothetical protein